MVSLVNELPIPSSSPATGRTAMGSIKLRPILCNTPKILSFIVSLSLSARESSLSVSRAGIQKGINIKESPWD